MDRQRRVTERLMRRGFAALHDGDTQRATRLGEILRERRHTSGFEIGARALYESGSLPEAAALLKEGLAIAPELGVLWHWLGTVLSDHADYDGAIAAFTRSLELGGAPVGMELANLALVCLRGGRPYEGLAWLDKVPEGNLDLPGSEIALLRSDLFLHAGDLPSASAWAGIARTFVTDSDGSPLTARIALVEAEIALRSERYDVAAALALRALEDSVNVHQERALRTLREARRLRSAAARRWRATVEGVIPDVDGSPLNFLRKYEVVAESERQCLAMISEVEACHGCRVSRLEEAQVIESAPTELCGVIRPLGGHICFGDEGE